MKPSIEDIATLANNHSGDPDFCLTELEIVDMLCNLENRAQWAKENGLSASYVSDVVNVRRGVSTNLAELIGYQKHAIFLKL